MRSRYKSIAEGIILTLLTCGIYNLFWNWHQMEACNELTGRREFEPVTVLLLSLVTCGLYFVYYQYRMGGVILDLQRQKQQQPFENLPVVSLLLSLFGMSIIVDAIHQHELNKFYPSPAAA